MGDPELTMSPVAKPGITRVVIDQDRSQSPTFDGMSFGSVGQYEKLRGIGISEEHTSELQSQ